MRPLVSFLCVFLFSLQAFTQSDVEPIAVTSDEVVLTPGDTQPVTFDLTFSHPAAPNLSTLDWQWVVEGGGSGDVYWNGTQWSTTAYWSPTQGESTGFFSSVSVVEGTVSGVFDPSDFPASFFDNGTRSFSIYLRYGSQISTTAATANFRIKAPTAPSGLAPSGVISSATPTLTWNTSSGADDYRVMIKRNDGTVINSNWATTVVSGTSLAFPETMPAGDSYRVHVVAVGTGGMSPSASTIDVVYQPPIPNDPVAGQITPLNNLADAYPTFTWTAVPNASSYTIGFLSETGEWLESDWRENVITGTSYQPTERFPNDMRFNVYLRAANANGQSNEVDMGEVVFFALAQDQRAGAVGDYNSIWRVRENIYYLPAGSNLNEHTFQGMKTEVKQNNLYISIASWIDRIPNGTNYPDGGYWNGSYWQRDQVFLFHEDLVNDSIFSDIDFPSSTSVKITYSDALKNTPDMFFAQKSRYATITFATDATGDAVVGSEGVFLISSQDIDVDLMDYQVFDLDQANPSINLDAALIGSEAPLTGGLAKTNVSTSIYERRNDIVYYWNFNSGQWVQTNTPSWLPLTQPDQNWTQSARDSLPSGMDVTHNASVTDLNMGISFDQNFAWDNFFEGSAERRIKIVFRFTTVLQDEDGNIIQVFGTYKTAPRNAKFLRAIPEFNATASLDGLGVEPLGNGVDGRLVNLGQYSHSFTASRTGVVPPTNTLPLYMAFAVYEDRGSSLSPVFVETLPVADMNNAGNFNLDDIFCQLEAGKRYYIVSYLAQNQGARGTQTPCPLMSSFPDIVSAIPAGGSLAFSVNGSTGHFVTSLSEQSIRTNGYVINVVPPEPTSFEVEDLALYHPEAASTPVDLIATPDTTTGTIMYAANSGSSIAHRNSGQFVEHQWALRAFPTGVTLNSMNGCTPTNGSLLAQSTDSSFVFGNYDPSGQLYDFYIMTYTAWDSNGIEYCTSFNLDQIRDFSKETLYFDFRLTGASPLVHVDFTVQNNPFSAFSCLKPDSEMKLQILGAKINQAGDFQQGLSVNVSVTFQESSNIQYFPLTFDLVESTTSNIRRMDSLPNGLRGCTETWPAGGRQVPYPFGFTISSLTDERTGRTYTYNGTSELENIEFDDPRPNLDTVVFWDPEIPIVVDQCAGIFCIGDYVPTYGKANVRPDPIIWEYTGSSAAPQINSSPNNVEVELLIDPDLFASPGPDWKVKWTMRVGPGNYNWNNGLNYSLTDAFNTTNLQYGGTYTLDLDMILGNKTWQDIFDGDFCTDTPPPPPTPQCISFADILDLQANSGVYAFYGYLKISRNNNGQEEVLAINANIEMEFEQNPNTVAVEEIIFNPQNNETQFLTYDTSNSGTTDLVFPYIINPDDDPPTGALQEDEFDWRLFWDDTSSTPATRYYWSNGSWQTSSNAWKRIDNQTIFNTELNTQAHRFIAKFSNQDIQDLLGDLPTRTLGVDLRYYVGTIPPQTPDPMLIVVATDELPPVQTLTFGPAGTTDLSVTADSQVTTSISFDTGNANPQLDAFKWSWRDGDLYWDGDSWENKPTGGWDDSTFVPVLASSGFFRDVLIKSDAIELSLSSEDLADFIGATNPRTVSIHLAIENELGQPLFQATNNPVDLTFTWVSNEVFVLTSPQGLKSNGVTDLATFQELELPADLKSFAYAPEPFVLATSNTVNGNLYYLLSRDPVSGLDLDQPGTSGLHNRVAGNEIYAWLTVPYDKMTDHPEVHAFLVPFNEAYIQDNNFTNAPDEIEKYLSRVPATLDQFSGDDVWTRSNNNNVIYKRKSEDGKNRIFVAIFVPQMRLETSKIASATSLIHTPPVTDQNTAVTRALLDHNDNHNRILSIHYLNPDVVGDVTDEPQVLYQLNFIDKLGRNKASRTFSRYHYNADPDNTAATGPSDQNKYFVTGIEQFDSLGRQTKVATAYLADMTSTENLSKLASNRTELFDASSTYWGSLSAGQDNIIGESQTYVQKVYEPNLGKERILANIPIGSRLKAVDELRYIRFHYFTIDAPTTQLQLYDLIPGEGNNPALMHVKMEIDPNGTINATLFGNDMESPLLSIRNPSVALMERWGLTVLKTDDTGVNGPTSFDQLSNTTVYLPEGYDDLLALNTDAVNQVSYMKYDKFIRLIEVHPPRSIELDLGTSGWSIDPISGESGLVQMNSYDSFDRLATSDEPDMDGATRFFYDQEGLTRISQNKLERDNNLWSVNYFDNFDRLIRTEVIYNTTFSINPGDIVTDTNPISGTVVRFTTTRHDRYNTATVSPFENESNQLHRWPAITDLEDSNPFSDNFAFGRPLGSITEVVSKNAASRSYMDAKGRVTCRVTLIRGVTEPHILWLDYNNKDQVVRQSYTNAAMSYGYRYDNYDRIYQVEDLDTLGARAIFHVAAARSVIGDTSQTESSLTALGPVLDEEGDAIQLANARNNVPNTKVLSTSRFSPTGQLIRNSYADAKITESYTYDVRDLLLEQKVLVGEDEVYVHNIDYFGVNPKRFTLSGYENNYNSNITWRREYYPNMNGGKLKNDHHYAYGLRKQLIKALTDWDLSGSDTTTHTYAYDKNGNRTSEDIQNAIIPSGTPPSFTKLEHEITQGTNRLDKTTRNSTVEDDLQYDVIGNVTQITTGTRTRTLNYISGNNANKVFAQSWILPYEIIDNQDGVTTTYSFAYDHEGKRIKRAVSGDKSELGYYLPFNNDNLAEMDSSGRITKAFTFSAQDRVGYKSKAREAIYIKDHLGSSKMTVAINRGVTQRVAASAAPDTRAAAIPVDTSWLEPVLHLTFDGQVDDHADTGENVFTIQGDPTYETSFMGQSLRFDGNGDYLELTSPITWDKNLESFTLAYWVKLANSVNDDNTTDTIIANHGGNDGFRAYLTNPSSTATKQDIFLTVYNPAGNTSVYSAPSGSKFLPDDQNWHHVVITRDGELGAIYIDGALAYEATSVTPFTNGSSTLTIGRNPNGSDELNGSLDDLKIWRRALTRLEVLDEYRKNPSVLGTVDPMNVGLAAAFRFENELAEEISNTSVSPKASEASPRFANGPVGRAYEMDGTNDFEMDIPALTSALGSEFTFSTWVRTDAMTGPYRAFFYAGGQDGNMDFFVNNTNGKMSLRTNTLGVSGNWTTGADLFPIDGAWHHLALTAQGTLLRFYIDGVQVWEETDFTGYTSARDRVAIGDQANGSMPLEGALDDIQIHSRALSGDEISALFNAQDSSPAGDQPALAFNFDNTTFDSGPSAAHGSFSGGTPTYTAGVVGQALTLDGVDDHVVLSPWETVDQDYTSFTFATWMRVDANLYAPTQGHTIFSTYDGVDGGMTFWMVSEQNINGQGRVYATTYNSGGTNVSTSDLLHYPDDNQWHHIALTGENGELKIYIDGILRQTGTAPLPASNSSNIYLGARNDGSQPLHGAMDQTVFYNRTLTAQEILNNYVTTAPVSTVAEGVDLLMHMEGEYEDAVSGNLGTPTGTPVFTDGISGQGLQFNGDGGWVSQPNTLFNSTVSDLTIAFWVRDDSPVVTSNSSEFILSNFVGGTGGFYTRLFKTTTSSNIMTQFTDGTSNYLISTDGFPSDGQWHHYAFILENGRAWTFVDGVRVKSGQVGNIGAATGALNIGTNTPNTNFKFKGAIDDLRIYQEAVPFGEIARLYQAGAADQTAVETFWTFDETLQDNNDAVDLASVSAYLYEDGVQGSAILLDGTDDMLEAAATAQVLSNGDNFSFETWIRMNTDLTAANATYTLAGNKTVNGGFDLTITADSSTTNAGRITYSTDAQTLHSTINLPNDQQWHHLAVINKDGRVSLFLDGSTIGSNGMEAAKASTATFTLGADAGGGNHLPAFLDETRVSVPAQSSEAVLARFFSNAPEEVRGNALNGLVGSWEFGTNLANQVTSTLAGVEGGSEGYTILPAGLAFSMEDPVYLNLGQEDAYAVTWNELSLTVTAALKETSGVHTLVKHGAALGLGGIALKIDADNNTVIFESHIFTGLTTITSPLGSWPEDQEEHTISVVKTSGDVYIYLDGQRIHNHGSAVANFPSQEPLHLGAVGTSLDVVSMDLYDRALTPWEVAEAALNTFTFTRESAQATGVRGVADIPYLLSRSDTDPYGNTRIETYNAALVDAGEKETHQFTGQEKEDDLDLYYYGARWYAPKFGSYQIIDTALLEANLYSYGSEFELIEACEAEEQQEEAATKAEKND